jgi:cell division septation protein DedD
MMPAEVSPARLIGSAPEMLGGATVVALVPLGEAEPVAAVAWEIGRRVAEADRRVVLVDLGLQRPLLRPRAEGGTAEGIADAFLYGASLQHVTEEQDVPGFFYIGVGTEPANPGEVWGHDRWQRLARGFASEDALLLLAIPPQGLDHLQARPDRVLALALTGGARHHRSLTNLLSDGVPVDLVVEERTPPARRATPPPRRRTRPVAARRVRPSRLRHPWLTAGIALASIGTVGILLALPGAGEDSTAADVAPPPPAEAAPDDTDLPGDSLFYGVQVAAFGALETALERLRGYEEAGWTATITPVQLGRQGTWHRLIVAAFPTAGAAERALTQLWRDGLVERPNGTILRTPHALLLGTRADSAAAAAEAQGLRDRGIPAYIVRAFDGTARLLVGAFETPEQARLADSILTAADLEGTLVARAGMTP